MDFCGTLAIRGPATVSDALTSPAVQMGRASAIMVLTILLAGAIGTQLAAPNLEGTSVLPVAFAMLVMTLASVLLVTPYPDVESAAAAARALLPPLGRTP
ncbi:MAG: hypothetical protein ABI885_12310 [Gammaproteobacteria bacterium]